MGQSTRGQCDSVHSALNMKMLVVLALVASVAAEPEAEAKADPYYLGGYYGGLGYGGLGYGGLGYAGLGYSGLRYGGYGYSGLGYYGKREADAEPKADADPYYLGGYYGGLGYSGLGYGGLGYSGLGYSGLGYGGYGYSGLGYYGKREADAEPKADADPYYLGGYY